MAASRTHQRYLLFSVVAHIGLLLLFVLSFEHTATLPVFENTNQNDVISAVVLGDTAKSKILPTKKPSTPPLPVQKPSPEKIIKQTQSQTQKDVIALKKPVDKKKLAEKKLLDEIKKKNIFAKDLLSDIKKETKKQKKLAQKNIQDQFQKLLREQSEKSLRQQLLNEEIKLQGTQSRQSQGEVNKYKALILQAISEHWIIPTQANKHLFCELLIRVAPGGMVLDVQVTKTSGDPSLDSSARAAVLKASPLPVPSTPDEFAAFRQFALKVKPENIMDAGLSV